MPSCSAKLLPHSARAKTNVPRDNTPNPQFLVSWKSTSITIVAWRNYRNCRFDGNCRHLSLLLPKMYLDSQFYISQKRFGKIITGTRINRLLHLRIELRKQLLSTCRYFISSHFQQVPFHGYTCRPVRFEGHEELNNSLH